MRFHSLFKSLVATLSLPIVVAEASGSWALTGSMSNKYSSYTASVLSNGKVLVAGGNFNRAAELYNVSTGTWSSAGQMSSVRFNHGAVVLSNGKVLVAGGSDASDKTLASVDLYDSNSGAWSAAAAMNSPRTGHTLTLLANGKVLAAGGSNSGWFSNVATAEVYDPVTNTWSNTGSMAVARKAHVAVLLANGEVLVTGGGDATSGSVRVADSELYSSDTGRWVNTGAMNVGRYAASVVLLASGKVLVAGGSSASNVSTASVEIFDLNSGTWHNTAAMNTARTWFAATLLPSNQVLVAGGCGSTCSTVVNTAEIYDSNLGTWGNVASLNAKRAEIALLMLSNGKVLAAGGYDGVNPLSSAELYTPQAMSTTTTLMSDINPSIPDQSVTFTASVSAANATPSGTLNFSVNEVLKQSGNIANGSASYSTVFTSGSYDVKAAFTGNTTFAASMDQLTQTCVAAVYTVTPGVGIGGTISPNTPQQVTAGTTKNFTLTANTGYTINAVVTGTCPQGSWNSVAAISPKIWTTGNIIGNCTVNFSFTPLLPVVTTKVASNITASSAILNGQVNSNGSAAAVTFDFGTTVNYGINNIAATPGTVNGNVAVTATRAGLICNTTYHYRVKATNNAGTKLGLNQSFVTAPCVDFVISSILINPVPPIANGLFTADIMIRNLGSTAGDGKFLDVWDNQPNVQTCGAVGTKRIAVGSIPAGNSVRKTVTNIPAGIVGAKTLRAFVDSDCGTRETNENNNQFTRNYTVAQPAGIDFVITAITINPTVPTANGTFTANVAIKNQGTLAGDGKFLDVWINQTHAQSCDAAGNKRLAVGNIDAGATKVVTVTGLPSSAAANKTLRTFVDSGCDTVEINESNNQLAKSYVVSPPPGMDFVVSAVVLNPLVPTAAGTFTANVTVKNQGNIAGDGKFLDVWANQTVAQACDAVGDKRLAIGAVAAGATKTLSVAGLAAGVVGSKTLRSFVDSGCDAVELNETNNQATVIYSVNPPPDIDFIVTNIDLARDAAGLVADVTVKNQGTVAGDGKFLDVWVNQPAVQNCGAVGDKRLTIGNLAAGASTTLNFSDLALGAGYKLFRAVADSGCGAAETNEDNNQTTKIYVLDESTGIDFLPNTVSLGAGSVAGTFNLTLTVKNQGTVAGDGGFVDVWSNQAENQFCGAAGDSRQAVGSMAAGATKTLTFTGLSLGSAGTKKLRVFVDSGCGTGEDSEVNNQAAWTYTVN